MLPIGHVPTQIYVNKTYIPHYNLAIIYIYFVDYIFFYIFFMFGQVLMALLSTVWKITRFLTKTLPLFVKTHKFAQNNYFFMTSDVLDRKFNKENQICNFSSFFNEKRILIEIWYSMNFCANNLVILFSTSFCFSVFWTRPFSLVVNLFCNTIWQLCNTKVVVFV